MFAQSARSIMWLAVLVDASVKGVVVLAAAGLLTLVLRRASAALRHLVWSLAMVSLIVLPVLSALLPNWQVPILPRPVSTSQSSLDIGRSGVSPDMKHETAPGSPRRVFDGMPALPVGTHYSDPASALMAKQTETGVPASATAVIADFMRAHWSALLLFAWVAGAVTSIAPLFVGMVGVWHRSRRARPVTDGTWARLVPTLSAELGLVRSVTLLKSDRAAIPTTWGVLRPVVLLPSEALDWSAERCRIVFLHELAHIRRCDWLTQVAARLACALYWFNPLAWIAARRIRVESEQACDDSVLRAGHKASGYADQLLEIVRTMRPAGYESLATVPIARRPRIQKRLAAILDANRNRRRVTRAAVALAVLGIGCIAVPVAAIRPVAKETRADEVQQEEPGAAGQWQAALPGGARVELVAIRRHQSDDACFWCPDGTPLQEGPYDHVWIDAFVEHPDVDAYEFSVRAVGLPEGTSLGMDPGGPGLSAWGRALKDGRAVKNLYVSSGVAREGIDSTTVRIGVPTGNWQVLGSTDGARQRTFGPPDVLVVLSEAYEKDGSAHVSATVNGPSVGQCHRLVAIEESGEERLGAPVDISKGDKQFRQTNYLFANLALKGVRRFRLDTSDYDWVEFKNVSLKPGRRTDVEVVTTAAETAAVSCAVLPLAAIRPTAKAQEPAEQTQTQSDRVEPVREWKVTLPAGVIVELIGVSYHPSEGELWWRPDGSLLDEAPYDTLSTAIAASENGQTREFAVRLENIPADGCGFRYNIAPSHGTGSATPYKGHQPARELRAVVASIPGDLATASVRVGIAAGPWEETVATSRGNSATAIGLKSGGVTFSAAHEVGNQTRITVSDTLLEFDHRVVAVDVNQKTHSSPDTDWVSAGAMRQTTASFDNLAPSDIEEFRFQTRPYEWVEFEIVSLSPSKRTDVEVVTNAAETVAASDADTTHLTAMTASEPEQGGEVIAQPLTPTDRELLEELTEFARIADARFGDMGDYRHRAALYHVRSGNEATVWEMLHLRRRRESEPDEVGLGSSRLVDAEAEYYLPDGTPLKSRWTPRGDGMHDICVNVGHPVAEAERVPLVCRHSNEPDQFLVISGTQERRFEFLSWTNNPGAWIVRLDAPLERAGYHPGGADVWEEDDWTELTWLEPPDAESARGYVNFTTPGLARPAERVRYQRTLATELSRTLSALDSVRSAQVHLALPEEALFAEEQKEPSASVLVSPEESRRLSADHIEAMLDLLTSSVEGLKRSNIAIVDTRGNVLAGTGDNTKPEQDAVPPERKLHFPDDWSIGTLRARDYGAADPEREWWWEHYPSWEFHAVAEGTVTVPAGKEVALLISCSGSEDFSPLAKLRPGDVDIVSIECSGESSNYMEPLSSLTWLETLVLHQKNIQNEDLRWLKRMNSLKRLSVFAIHLNDGGIAHVGQLTSLKSLRISGEDFTDAGLAHLSNLVSLEEMFLGRRDTLGDGLAHLAKLPLLERLDFYAVTVSGAGAAHLSASTSLKELNFNKSDLMPEHLGHIAAIPRLETLQIHRMITDDAVARLSSARSLKKLILGMDFQDSRDLITDAGLASLSKVSSLESIGLYYGKFTDEGLEHLSELANLKSLAIPNCRGFTDAGLEHLSKLSHLEHLDLRRVSFSDAGLKRLKEALPNCDIKTDVAGAQANGAG